MQDSSAPPPSPALRAVLAIYALALALWGGGLVVLGAVVAPIVFRVVPAPTSADAMTLVFRRFDAIAITCAVVVLVSEATLARIRTVPRERPAPSDLVRAGSAVLASLLAIVLGAYVSPRIAELHREGAIRGLGESGLALERSHHLAESIAKAELFFVLATLVLLLVRAGRAPRAQAKDDASPA